MLAGPPFNLGGFVLAGGRSSRMGSDKALLQLAGHPLVHHAVSKLRRVCADVHILTSNPALASYAPLVRDLHPDCGPIGGIEAALTHSPHPWNLFLAVDMPFLPVAFIAAALSRWLGDINPPPIRMFTAEDRPQPGFCLIHKQVAPFLAEAIARGDFKLMRVFETAVNQLATRRGTAARMRPWKLAIDTIMLPEGPGDSSASTPAQLEARSLWFANLNTPEDFAQAELRAAALDSGPRPGDAPEHIIPDSQLGRRASS